MRIGYSKLGRSWKLNPVKGTAGGGDADVARGLHLLARMRPNDQFILVGKNSGENPQAEGYPENVINPWTSLKFRVDGKCDQAAQVRQHIRATEHMFPDLDHNIMWLGQHGTSNMPIPKVENRTQITQPQQSFINYGSYLLTGINKWRDVDPRNREEIQLCPDPRNYLKARDLKWPLQRSIIAQYKYERTAKHERYGDETNPMLWTSHWDPANKVHGVWVSPSEYTYNALEMTNITNPSQITDVKAWDQRSEFGMLVNENRAYVSKDRLTIMEQWVLPHWPEAEIFGVWSDASQKKLQRTITPVLYSHVGKTLQRWKSTITTPASGSGWATAKPWECFNNGTICFFHPWYDDQDHILRDAPAELRAWLRVKTAAELRVRVARVNEDKATYEWLASEQKKYLVAKYDEHQGGIGEIMRRLG